MMPTNVIGSHVPDPVLARLKPSWPWKSPEPLAGDPPADESSVGHASSVVDPARVVDVVVDELAVVVDVVDVEVSATSVVVDVVDVVGPAEGHPAPGVVVVVVGSATVVVVSTAVVVVLAVVVDVDVLVVWATASAAVRTMRATENDAMTAAASSQPSPASARLMVVTGRRYRGPETARRTSADAPVNDLQTLPAG